MLACTVCSGPGTPIQMLCEQQKSALHPYTGGNVNGLCVPALISWDLMNKVTWGSF